MNSGGISIQEVKIEVEAKQANSPNTINEGIADRSGRPLENDTFRGGLGLEGLEKIPNSQELVEKQQDPIAVFFNRMYYSNECKYFYLFMMFVNTILIVWTILDYRRASQSWAFLILEILINLIVVGDVLGRIRMTGCHFYWREKWNIIEFIIVICCLISFSLAFIFRKEEFQIENLADLLFIIIRSIVQYLRIIIFLKNHKQNQERAKELIDFENLASDEVSMGGGIERLEINSDRVNNVNIIEKKSYNNQDSMELPQISNQISSPSPGIEDPHNYIPHKHFTEAEEEGNLGNNEEVRESRDQLNKQSFCSLADHMVYKNYQIPAYAIVRQDNNVVNGDQECINIYIS